MSLKQLIKITKKYGLNPDYVLAGGGNTSLKDNGIMYIKASGCSMANADEKIFVKMRQSSLDALWHVEYPAAREAREAAVLSDLMNARLPGETARPSSETLMHGIIPFRYVVHIHPSIVNALTCSKNGEIIAQNLFSDAGILWVPEIMPGYTLAKYVRDRVDDVLSMKSSFPGFIFLQNHGVFAGGDTPEEIAEKYNLLFNKIKSRLKIIPNMDELPFKTGPEDRIGKIIKKIYGPEAGLKFFNIKQIAPLIEDKKASATFFDGCLTPDHIVYMGRNPLWLDNCDSEVFIENAFSEYKTETGLNPGIILVKGKGVVACADTSKKAKLAEVLYKDAIKVITLADNFGGVNFMSDNMVDFIVNWEVEKYRAQRL